MNMIRKALLGISGGALALALFAFNLWRGERSRRQQAENEALDANQRADVQANIEKARAEVRREASEHDREKQDRRRSGERPSGNFGDRL